MFLAILIVGTSALINSDMPPIGTTGAPPIGPTDPQPPDNNCANSGCHVVPGSPPVGSGITETGLPTTYTPGVTYTFSLTINHGALDRLRFGFSIAARSSSNASIGTFSTTNDTAALNGPELSHFNAPVLSSPQTSYTYGNLMWTAPAIDIGPVTFYYAGNAANGSGRLNDYIYTGSTISSSLPITLYAFNAVVKNNDVLLSWQTSQEINSNYFSVQKSYDNKEFSDIGKINASGNSSLSTNYSFTDDNPSSFEKPIYYRLAMVDKDGAKIYSKIANVILRATSTFIKGVYPNPLKAGNILHVNFVSRDDETVFVKLIDNAGRLVKNIQINVQKGSNILDVKTPESSTGNYKLIIKSGAGLMQEHVMIR